MTRASAVAGPTSVDRRNRQRLVTVAAGLAGGVPSTTSPGRSSSRSPRCRPTARSAGYNVSMGGQSEQQAKAFQNLILALALSVVLEYAAGRAL